MFSISETLLNDGRFPDNRRVSIMTEDNRIVILSDFGVSAQLDLTSDVMDDFRTVVLSIKEGNITYSFKGSIFKSNDRITIKIVFENLNELSDNLQFILRQLALFTGVEIYIRLIHSYGPSFVFKSV